MHNTLKSHFYPNLIEAGCDEAGRGCLAGSVFAAAVILPPNYDNAELNDSKQLSRKSATHCAKPSSTMPWRGQWAR